MKNSPLHKPVMADEIIDFLKPQRGQTVLDATIGCGGHAAFILDRIKPGGLLIGVDRDAKTLEIADKELRGYEKTYKLVHSNFKDIDRILNGLDVAKIDGALFDLGFSSYQIGDAGRGFSFEHDGFLDMRMDTSKGPRAYDIVNSYGEKELARIIFDFGQERYSRKIARFILKRRKENYIKSTAELADIIKRAVGRRYRAQRIHPATRTFQALRIAVNDELENITVGLDKIPEFLSPVARLCVISFHSLEDRIVKLKFKEFEKSGFGRVITKKPITATQAEIRDNPRARSAKFRVFEAKR